MTEHAGGEGSLEERVAREHEQLEPLFEATREALSQGSGGSAFECVTRLREALETHTAQEDQLYYPALWSLCPQHKSTLEHFIHSHTVFRSDLDEIGRRIIKGDLSSASDLFESFSKSFATHEVYEEELLRKIDAESFV